MSVGTDRLHFPQRLVEAGYRTGYFGKWHVERTNRVADFGWQESVVKGAEHLNGIGRGEAGPDKPQLDETLCGHVEGPVGLPADSALGVSPTRRTTTPLSA